MPEHGLGSEEEIVQWRLKMMTTQRFANLLEMADVIGDMGPDGLEILRKLGDPEYLTMRKFLREGKPETFQFLAELRKEEVSELGNAIENARAFRRGGRLLRWSIVTLFGTFVGMSVIWDKVSALWKAPR